MIIMIIFLECNIHDSTNCFVVSMQRWPINAWHKPYCLIRNVYSQRHYMNNNSSKSQRSLCAPLCSSTSPLFIETGRFNGLLGEEGFVCCMFQVWLKSISCFIVPYRMISSLRFFGKMLFFYYFTIYHFHITSNQIHHLFYSSCTVYTGFFCCVSEKQPYLWQIYQYW